MNTKRMYVLPATALHCHTDFIFPPSPATSSQIDSRRLVLVGCRCRVGDESFGRTPVTGVKKKAKTDLQQAFRYTHYMVGEISFPLVRPLGEEPHQ